MKESSARGEVCPRTREMNRWAARKDDHVSFMGLLIVSSCTKYLLVESSR